MGLFGSGLQLFAVGQLLLLSFNDASCATSMERLLNFNSTQLALLEDLPKLDEPLSENAPEEGSQKPGVFMKIYGQFTLLNVMCFGGALLIIFKGFRDYMHSGWIIMEVATIICGIFYFTLAPFPFLMFPVAFCFWFLSMDMCPLVRGWPNNAFEIRRNVSVVIGLLMIVAAYIMEYFMGANPDYAFWLYLFGLLTFLTPLVLYPSGSDLDGAVYLLINVSICIVGSQLGRTTFHVFGTLGIIFYTSAYVSNTIRNERLFFLWILKAVAASILFAQAIKTEGNFEIIGGMFCVAVFNYNSMQFLASSELYCILVLVTNLGFVSTATAFRRPVNLWFFVVDGKQTDLVGILCCFVVTIFHGGLVWYSLPKNRMTTWTQYKEHLYHLYRVLASVLLSFCFFLLGYPRMAFLGWPGVLIAAVNYWDIIHNKLSFKVVSVVLLVFGIFFSNFLQSNVLYLISCLILLAAMMSFICEDRTNDVQKAVGFALSVLVAFLSVLIHYRFMTITATIPIFAYFGYLVNLVFKNSLYSPTFTLVLSGGATIFSGVVYTRSMASIQAMVDYHMPKVLTDFLSESSFTDWGLPNWSASIAQSELKWSSFVGAPTNWILWSGTLSYSLSEGSAPYIPAAYGLSIVVVLVVFAVHALKEDWTPYLTSGVQITDISAKLKADYRFDPCGMIIEVLGTKPSYLNAPLHVAFTLDGNEFWSKLNEIYGEREVQMARFRYFPLKLTPQLITFDKFCRGSTSFKATILLGTGYGGSHQIKHATVTDFLRRLDGTTMMQLTLMFSNAWYQPYSRLCEKTLAVDKMFAVDGHLLEIQQ